MIAALDTAYAVVARDTCTAQAPGVQFSWKQALSMWQRPSSISVSCWAMPRVDWTLDFVGLCTITTSSTNLPLLD